MAAYGLPEPDASARETLPLSQRLLQIADADSRSLAIARPCAIRSVGTCRDYALMLCAMLRQRRIPARVRCGFAAYFDRGRWEDHWICEYWRPAEDRWCRVDAQLDELLRQRLAIEFDTTDVPPDMFMPAGDAWRLCRTSHGDPARFGHGTACGLWFVRVNVVRDHHAMNNLETSAWDSWRQAAASHRLVDDAEARETDLLALHPDSSEKLGIAPPWMA
jgi:transglutaminase-like putative cysteine protease